MYMLAFEDVSDRVAKEAELARVVAELERTNQRQDEFLAMLSHELRNPLSPIQTSVGVLKLAPGSTHATEAVELIDRSVGHLTRIVDDLLDVTRITRGTIALRRQPIELVALLQRVLADRAGEFADRGLVLETSIAPEPLWIDGDPERLVQVLNNVLGNAEKFTPPGHRIVIGTARSGGTALITVRDTGIGISPDLIEAVFEPFVQAPQGLDRSRGGLGLGLAMVKSLVELHGGKVRLFSAGIDQGTEVSIRLPLQSPPAPPPGSNRRRRVHPGS
jgi:signal transduction histidine kinase